MAVHFEELWEQCESFHKDESSSSISSILEELSLKLNLYKTISAQKDVPQDLKDAKSRLLGEIVLTLTNLSLREDINVYDSLTIALRTRSIQKFSQKS